MSQMDLAGGTYASYCANGRVATIAVEGFIFHQPVFVGDEVTCYCKEVRRGRTSLAIRVEAWVRRGKGGDQHKVTEGLFTFVAIGADRKPRPVGDAQPDVCDC
jgi:acyl-CoA thioesterase YciA